MDEITKIIHRKKSQKSLVKICEPVYICKKNHPFSRSFTFSKNVSLIYRVITSADCGKLKVHLKTKNTTTREQPPRTCKNSNSKMKSDSAIGQHLLTNPECAKTYTDDNFRIIGQARSSFHLGVLESVYIKTQNPVLCKQKEFVFSLGLFK